MASTSFCLDTVEKSFTQNTCSTDSFTFGLTPVTGSVYVSCYTTPSPNSNSAITNAVIIGGSVGGAVGLILIIILCLYCYRKMNTFQSSGSMDTSGNYSNKKQEIGSSTNPMW